MGTGYHLLHLCLLLAICLHCAEHASAECRPEDVSALLSFRKTFVNRPRGEDEECHAYLWDENEDCCLWTGIDCDNDTVVTVSLSEICGRGTSDSFSSKSSLFKVSTIKTLDMSYVDLAQSTIPNEIGQLTRLENLELRASNLTGPIPDAVGTLTQLRVLYLSYNGLSGRIPPTLSKLKLLERLDIRQCKLTGGIPGGVFSLPLLQTVNLELNQLSGYLPSTISGPSSLQRLEMWSNRLEGPIPSWLFQIPSLTFLSLHNNSLGPLKTFPKPQLTTLYFVDLSLNKINGPLKPLLQLVNVTWLNLQATQLNGVIPPTIGSVTQLRWLDLSKNKLEGRIPQTLMKVESLETLDLSFNNLWGPIPPGRFPNTSYIGNPGLCGPPLSITCPKGK